MNVADRIGRHAQGIHCPGQTLLTAHEFAQDARSMEAKRPVSHHREEMQEDAAKAEAREGQHGVKRPSFQHLPAWRERAPRMEERPRHARDSLKGRRERE
jgi:hypothetical protein